MATSTAMARVSSRVYNSSNLPITPEFQVNQFTKGDQINASVAMDANGDFVVAWQSNDEDPYDGTEDLARRYDLIGQPLSDEFRVNTVTIGDQIDPQIAMNYGGQFVIAWTSESKVSSFQNSVDAQLYNADGTANGGQIQVNDSDIPGLFQPADPSVAISSTGDFVVAFDERVQTQITNSDLLIGSSVVARLFNSSGTPLTDVFQVSLNTTNVYGNLINPTGINTGYVPVSSKVPFAFNPSVAMDDQGNFTIVYQAYQETIFSAGFTPPESFGIYMRRFHYDATPSKFTGEALVNTDITVNNPLAVYPGAGNHLNPSVSVAADDSFVVTWSGPGLEDFGAEGFAGVEQVDAEGISYREYDPDAFLDTTDPSTGETVMEPPVGGVTNPNGGDIDDGSLNFPETLVNSTTTGTQNHPAVAMNREGDFVVVWSGNGVGASQGIFSQYYKEASDAVGPLVTSVSVANIPTDASGNVQLAQATSTNVTSVPESQQVLGSYSQIVVPFDTQVSTAGGSTAFRAC